MKNTIAFASLCAVLICACGEYMTAKKVRTEAYEDQKNIVIKPAPGPLLNFNFNKEFRVNTADVDSPHLIQMSLSLGYKQKYKKLGKELSARRMQMINIIEIILSGKKKNEDEEKALFDCLEQGIEQTFADGTAGWKGERVRRETQRIQNECMGLPGTPAPPRPPGPARAED